MIGFRRILFRANGRNCVAEKNTVAAHVIADIVLLESVYANAERSNVGFVDKALLAATG